MCLSAFLFFAAVYMLLPILPELWVGVEGCATIDVVRLYGVYGLAMLLVGPFHAYLGDAYKRKYVLMAGMVAVALAWIGMLHADNQLQCMGLMALWGAGLGVASTAGITVAIDITSSSRRTLGNETYATFGRAGMLVGILLGWLLREELSIDRLIYVAMGLDALALLIASQVYVAFRAPIGLPLLSMDRFLLPRAWLPAINLCLFAFGAGVLLQPSIPWGVLPLALLVLLTTHLTQLFVRLSHHCQRGTANTTFQLAVDLGILAGCAFRTLHADATQTLFSEVGWGTCVAAVILYLLGSLPYYQKKRVR